jgi:hypothetical protein
MGKWKMINKYLWFFRDVGRVERSGGVTLSGNES